MNATTTTVAPARPSFREATRALTSILAPLEKRCLIWLAWRLPPWITSDHLTALALAAMLLAGLSYWLARVTPVGLLLVNVCLAVNWFGDSLDGTLARVRHRQRPRYGFYVDHVVDALGVASLLGGLALSGYMSPLIALILLAAYLLLCIEVYLATYCVGTFKVSFFKIGPTELRILLAIGNLALLGRPTPSIGGHAYQLFDVAGVIGAVGLLLTLFASALWHTRELYRAEPVPTGADGP
jgi:archaetidylinositol phosphate synthase